METISSSETLCAPLFRCSRTTRKYQNGSVEDFTTRELAAKRAADYIVVGTYERLNHVYPQVDTSKTSLRLWAIARGKRVYALTTDSSLLTYIRLPEICGSPFLCCRKHNKRLEARLALALEFWRLLKRA